MRNLFLMASLLICLTSVNVFAQETPPAQKPATETEQPKTPSTELLMKPKRRARRLLVFA